MVTYSPSLSSYRVGGELNATCTSGHPGVSFSWRIASAQSGLTLFNSNSQHITSSSQLSVWTLRPITFYPTEQANMVCGISSSNANLLQSETAMALEIEGKQ